MPTVLPSLTKANRRCLITVLMCLLRLSDPLFTLLGSRLYQSVNQFNSNLAAREPDSK